MLGTIVRARVEIMLDNQAVRQMLTVMGGLTFGRFLPHTF